MSAFSNNLEALRQEHDLTYEDLADKLGSYRSTIWRYIKGERIPDIDFAIKVALAFGVSLDWLLGSPYAPTDKHSRATTNDVENWTSDELQEIELYKNLIKEKRKLKERKG